MRITVVTYITSHESCRVFQSFPVVILGNVSLRNELLSGRFIGGSRLKSVAVNFFTVHTLHKPRQSMAQFLVANSSKHLLRKQRCALSLHDD